MLVDLGEALCYLLLTIMVTCPGNAFWWKKVDLRHNGGNT
jgi:hypothetical protein